jgi:hypothetical protein
MKAQANIEAAGSVKTTPMSMIQALRSAMDVMLESATPTW